MPLSISRVKKILLSYNETYIYNAIETVCLKIKTIFRSKTLQTLWLDMLKTQMGQNKTCNCMKCKFLKKQKKY